MKPVWNLFQKFTSLHLSPGCATHSSVDARPEIAIKFGYGGIYIYWHSNRDGNYEIYRTAYDTLNINYRITSNDSTDTDPSPLYIVVPVRQYEPEFAYMSTQNGNPDIYYRSWAGSMPVDLNPAVDSFPVVTADGRVYIWVLWQTNRNGNSDIYGSYWYSPGSVLESYTDRPSCIKITPNPFTDRVTFRLEVKNQLPVTIQICDVIGNSVKTFSIPTPYASTDIIWDGTADNGNAVLPGIYFVLIKSNDMLFQGKIVKLL